ncbi:hypothetical protein F383_10278 [Gossypium arboreum]|uniref:Uncharacterized protein n=1 Tax=Gossypium arboreum TaxID=29729 RepID=A0A0B0P6I5_GOSAR|nr:hypothetical protein F383_10278 [Gossypium arboreum]
MSKPIERLICHLSSPIWEMSCLGYQNR